MKEASTTMHEAKKTAKVMAESIAKLTLNAINVICTYHVYEVKYNSIFECINSIKDEKLKIALLSKYKTIAFSNEKFIFSSSKIAPAFNEQGAGIQYEFSFTIKTLLKIGYLKEK